MPINSSDVYIDFRGDASIDWLIGIRRIMSNDLWLESFEFPSALKVLDLLLSIPQNLSHHYSLRCNIQDIAPLSRSK